MTVTQRACPASSSRPNEHILHQHVAAVGVAMHEILALRSCAVKGYVYGVDASMGTATKEGGIG